MKALFARALLFVTFTLCGFAALPTAALANTQAPVPLVAPPAPKPAPAVDDFSDQDFAQADQAELGDRHGGDGVGLVIFLLLVILLVLLIFYLVDHGRL